LHIMDRTKVNIIRPEDIKKKKVNRTRLVIFFLITGLLSLGLWWRGKAIHGKIDLTGLTEPLKISYVVEPTPTTETMVKKQSEKLVADIGQLVGTASGTYAFYVFRPESGVSYGLRENEVMPGASIMKVPVIVNVQEAIANGRISPDDTYTMEEADRATGSGPLQFELAGKTYKISELLTYLGKNSDNTAWVMFNRRLGYDTIEDTVAEMGMTETSYRDLNTTAKDVARMFAYIYRNKAGGETGKEAIWGYLSDSIYEDRISMGIPDGVDLVHKVGTDADIWSDAGVIIPKSGKIEPFILVILDKGVDRNEAANLVPEITRRVWDFESKDSGL
jgi:beta-lactamase class A